MIKKISLVIISLLILASPVMAGTGLNDLQVAELMAIPIGRSIGISESVVISVWHTGPESALFSVSGGTGDLTFIEDGAVETTIPQLLTTGIMDVSEATANTVGQIVDLINLDSQGYWHAFAGPDATRGTAISTHMLNDRSLSAPSISEGSPTEATLDSLLKDYITCGVRGEAGAAPRIVAINASLYSAVNAGWIEVWSDTGRLWSEGIDVDWIITSTTGGTVSVAADGIGADWSDGICVIARPKNNILTSEINLPATGSVSIVYEVFNPN